MTMHRATFILAGALLAAVASPASAQAVQKVSLASNAQSYRADAARHVYGTYSDQIYKGMLPPLVHAIVVLEVDVDASGQVRDVHMIRVPTHAPDVTARVRELIRHASPMPAPSRLGATRFTEIWLVDKSGRFQLDTLTEGQL